MTKQARDTLKSLFSSAIRADLLALLLNNADERFYVREIATLLRKNPSGVTRELDNLENMGILISKKVANLKYFQAEKKSPFFTELKSIIAKSLGVPGALKAMLKTTGVKIAFIFGPYTESEEAETVNVLIVGSVSLDGIKDEAVAFTASLVHHLALRGYQRKLVAGAARSSFGQGEPHLLALMRILALCERRAPGAEIRTEEHLPKEQEETESGTVIVVRPWREWAMSGTEADHFH